MRLWSSAFAAALAIAFVAHDESSTTAPVNASRAAAIERPQSASPPALVRAGAVFSTAQTTSQSFLRFYNPSNTAGTATVTLRDYLSGQMLATWTSPSIPAGSEQQFPISTVEAGATQSFAKPSYYTADIQSTFDGYFQHVLWRAADGTLTNLSTCDTGITAEKLKLSGVHSGLLASAYPSSIVVNNTGTAATTAQLSIYDARDGTKIGQYTTASIPPNGQLVLTMSTIESAARLTPGSGMFHYVVRANLAFTGFLQHLVNNVKAGVVTDMTTQCTLNDFTSAAPSSPTRVGAVFSSAQSGSQSYLRFFNTGTSAATATLTLQDYTTGQTLGQWTSSSIPAGTEQQFSIASVETGTGQNFAKPSYYSVGIQSGFQGYFQHVLFRAADGTLTNLSTCDGGITSDIAKLSGVHSSLLASGYPSSIVINNTGAAAIAVPLSIYDARDGTKLGTYTTASIPINAQLVLPVSTIEAAARIAPTAGMYHYVIKADGVFTGFMQHLVNNVQVGVTTDMTTSCALAPQLPGTTLTYVANSTTKIEQVIGDCDYEIQAKNGTCKRTTSQSATRYNVAGNGQGNTFEDNGKMLMLFGDTISRDVNAVNYHGYEPIGYSTSTDPEGGLKVDFFTQSDGTVLLITLPGIPLGPYSIPNAGISLTDGVYLVCNVGGDASLDDPHTNAYSMLVKFDETAKTFTAGRIISQHPSGGHFVFTALHKSGNDVLMFGSGNYRLSDIYLSKTPATTFATGTGTQYFAGFVNGQPAWSSREADSVPVVQDNPFNGPAWPNDAPTAGNISVAYSSDLNLWLMTFDGGRQSNATTGQYFTYAQQPWGPWATPQLIFNDNRDGATAVYVHDPSIQPDPPGDGLNGPVIGVGAGANPYTLAGGSFAPLMIERFLRVSGNTLTIYYNVSTWNPYTVVLMRSNFTIGSGGH